MPVVVTDVFGQMGAGKTYFVVAKYIIPAIKAGQWVVTNIEGLRLDLISVLYADPVTGPLDVSRVRILSDNEVRGFWRLAEELGSNVLFVIDEIQNYYGSSNYRENKDSREELKVFVTKMRHSAHVLVYICQVPDMVHGDILKLTNTHIQCANLGFLGIIPGMSRRFTWIARKTYKITSKSVISQGTMNYDPLVYQCYSSMQSGVFESKTESDNLKFIPKKPLIIIFLFVFIFVIIKVFIFNKKPPAVVGSGASGGKSLAVVEHDSKNVGEVIDADGWMAYGDTVVWLRACTPVARSVDSGYRWGRRAVLGGGWVHVVAVGLSPAVQAGQSPPVADESTREPSGVASARSSSLPVVGGR